jgi:hypothetical protein
LGQSLEKKVVFILGATFLFLVLFNQNCSKVAVSDISSAQPSLSITAQSCADSNTCEQPTPNPPPPAVEPVPPGTHPPIAEFQCKQIVRLALSNTLQIPARDNSGTCYSVKLLDAVANSSSALSPDLDAEVTSRNHDSDSASMKTRHPYVLGADAVNMILADRRLVKLSSSGEKLVSIRVDNFLLVGIFPQLGTGQSADLKYYRSFGTADSTIPATDGILFRGSSVRLQTFGASGTSTVDALDITSDIQPQAAYTLDLRALDCGGVRELSDIYLLFQ